MQEQERLAEVERLQAREIAERERLVAEEKAALAFAEEEAAAEAKAAADAEAAAEAEARLAAVEAGQQKRQAAAQEAEQQLQQQRMQAQEAERLAAAKAEQQRLAAQVETARLMAARIAAEEAEHAALESARLSAQQHRQPEPTPEPEPEPEPAVTTTTTLTIIVPANSFGGDIITIDVDVLIGGGTTSRGEVDVAIPKGLQPGDEFEFELEQQRSDADRAAQEAAALVWWLDGLAIAERAKERFVSEKMDGESLARMRRNLSAPARCNAQLSELRDTYGLETLGDRLRFMAALEQLEPESSGAGGAVSLRQAQRSAREALSGVSAACKRARALLQEGNTKASKERWPEAVLAYKEGLAMHLELTDVSTHAICRCL